MSRQSWQLMYYLLSKENKVKFNKTTISSINHIIITKYVNNKSKFKKSINLYL